MKRFSRVLYILSLLLLTVMPVYAQSQESKYFEDTGHYVKGEFLAYYNSVPKAKTLFGSPITEEFSKNGRTIQYFERARFELHPERPAGQRVKLTPIGSALYAKGEQLNIINPLTCRYYTKTGFSVCFAFLDFFKENGGPERFGYPISPFEYHNDLIVQYFENARFEWKPWLPEGERVSIAELGRPYFDQQGEDPSRLTPLPPPDKNVKAVQLHARAFAWKAVTLASDQQLVYVIVQDQNLQPILNAQGTATVRWADGTNGVYAFFTNSSGVGIVPLTFVNQPYGKTVIIKISVSKDGQGATTTTSFRIWY